MPKGIRKYGRGSTLGVLFNTDGDGGGGTPPADEDKPDQQPPATGDQPVDGEDKLGDAGKQALDRMKAERNEEAKQRRALQKELEELRAATQSEQEKALATARKEGESAARAAIAPRLVAAEFKAASAGRLTAEQLSGFLEDLDLTKYLTEDGEVDTERVATKVALLAPQTDPRTPSFNGGARTPEPKRAGNLGEAIQARLAKKS